MKEDDDDFEEIDDWKYHRVDISRKEKFSNLEGFSILHLKVHSIQLHIEEIQVVLNLLKFEFDILCFSESKAVEGTLPKCSWYVY